MKSLTFFNDVSQRVAESFARLNLLARPRLWAVAVSLRVGRFKEDAAQVAAAKAELEKITGQLPSGRIAKKAISSFKLKEGELVGFLVTLRGRRMWAFVEKLVKVVLPAVRDFRGLPVSSLDRQGNLTIGFREQTVFPEVDANKIDHLRGVAVTLKIQNSKDPETAKKYWRCLGLVFAKGDSN